MRPGLLRLALAAGCLALLGLAPAPAYADDAVGRIDHVDTGDGNVLALFSIPGLPDDAVPDPSTLEVSFDGQPVKATAATQSGSAGVRRTSVLAIDVSRSMSGEAFGAAKAAASAYIDRAPNDVYIGLVTFASTVDAVQAPTQDHAALSSAIASLQLTPQTRLYEGVLESVEVAGAEGQRTILLLSDGKDTTSTSLGSVVTTADAADIRVDVVALNQQITRDSPLYQIANSTGGTVTSTSDLDKLEAVFADEADDLARQLLVTFPPPDDGSRVEGTLTVSIAAGAERYDDQAFVSVAVGKADEEAPTYTASGSSFRISAPWLLGGVGLLFTGLALLLGFGLNSLSPKPISPMQQQLSLYTLHGIRRTDPADQPQPNGGVDLRQTAVKIADRLVVQGALEDRIARKLDAAGLRLKAAEWVLIHAAVAIGTALVGLVVSGGSLLVLVVFLLLGAALPWLYLSFKAGRRLKAFSGGLAETLQILSGGLQAGLSLTQAVDTIVKEGAEPIASEFNRAMMEQRLGVEIEDALETVAERMSSVDFKWVVMAIRIQREVGGNLAELLLNVAGTLREREFLRRQVSVLSAEGKLSAYILGGLPPLFVGYLLLTRPEYVAPMFHTALGWVMTGAAVVMMVIGSFWLKQAVKVEV